MTRQAEEVLRAAINTYGKANQVDKAIEEMAELTKELLKDRQNAGSVSHIIEEIADVHIMLLQMLMIYDKEGTVNDYIDFKIKRLEHKLKQSNK